LKWGDPPARIVAWADQLKLDKTWTEPGRDPRLTILTVSSPDGGQLPEHAASSLEVRFTEGRLFEVTVHYSFGRTRPQDVRADFLLLKKKLALRHGAFRPGGNRRAVADGIVTKSESYQVSPSEDRRLVLVYSEVRDEKRGDSAAEFSLLYHNGSIRKPGVAREKPVVPAGATVVPEDP
jgi:hypothetical protein